MSNGIPSHDTFGRVFRGLESEAFQAQFVAWTEQVCQITQGQGVAADGKKLRRSQAGAHGRDGVWMVSAWARENRMVLGQGKVADKSNEIAAIPRLLSAQDSVCQYSSGYPSGWVRVLARTPRPSSANKRQAKALRGSKKGCDTLLGLLGASFDNL